MSGVSFIVTVFNKAAYLPLVVESLRRQEGDLVREFIFVDDGSTDGSADLLATLTRDWTDPVIILRQANRGASAATNAGAASATQPWLKLLDGDDLLVPGATRVLLHAATASNETLAYGDLAPYPFDHPDPLAGPFADPPFHLLTDGLADFIRNCPANSSSILVGAARYAQAGGCDERLVSPDQALFLRLFACGGGVRVAGPVALIPTDAPGRLSGQRRRSRYESVLALYHLVTETRGVSARHAGLAYRRALSRAYRFNRAIGGGWFNRHLWPFLRSHLPGPADPAAMHRALGAFTEDGRPERPSAWLPGALR